TTDNTVCLGRGLAGIKANEDVFQDYLNYYLQFPKSQFTSVSQGSTFTAINSGDLKAIQITLPPYKAQEYFSEILATIDKDIAKTDLIIKKTELLKRATFSEILHKQNSWREVKLKDIAEFKNGINFSKGQKGD